VFNLVIVAKDTEPIKRLDDELTKQGFNAIIIADIEQLLLDQPLDLLLWDWDTFPADLGKLREERKVPIIVLICAERLLELNFPSGVDDFVVKPMLSCHSCSVYQLSSGLRLGIWRRLSNLQANGQGFWHSCVSRDGIAGVGYLGAWHPSLPRLYHPAKLG
jgi:hypothetical protein